MAFVFVMVGLLAIVTGAKGTYAQFGSQVVSDFTGSKPFTWWVLAIGGIGALGYIDALRTFSRLFMTLILLSMLLSNRGFFTQLTAAIKAGPTPPQGGTGVPATNQASSSAAALPTSQQPTTGLFGQSAGQPGATGTSGQSKFNQYMNKFSSWLGSAFGGTTQ